MYCTKTRVYEISISFTNEICSDKKKHYFVGKENMKTKKTTILVGNETNEFENKCCRR